MTDMQNMNGLYRFSFAIRSLRQARCAAVVAIALLLPGSTFAQWATFSGTDTFMTGGFSGGSGDYAGIIAVTVSNATDGDGTGIGGLVAINHTTLTSTFYSHWTANGGTTLAGFAMSYTDPGDSYQVTMDFSGIGSGGYLPAGTILSLLDVDKFENFRNMRAFDAFNAQIGTPWLAAIGGQAGLLDYNSASGDLGYGVLAPTWTQTGGVNDFLGQVNNQDSAFYAFKTLQNVQSLTFFSDLTPGTAGAGGAGIALQAVPEPAVDLGAPTDAAALGAAGKALADEVTWERAIGRLLA